MNLTNIAAFCLRMEKLMAQKPVHTVDCTFRVPGFGGHAAHLRADGYHKSSGGLISETACLDSFDNESFEAAMIKIENWINDIPSETQQKRDQFRKDLAKLTEQARELELNESIEGIEGASYVAALEAMSKKLSENVIQFHAAE